MYLVFARKYLGIMDNVFTSFGAVRRIANVPLVRLAEAAGCSRSKLWRAEAGKGYARLTPEEADRIAAALGVPTKTIFKSGDSR